MAHKVICIGRQFGSGGREIALRTGERLDLPVYDRDLLSLACAYGDLAVEKLEKADEAATNPYLFQGVYEGNQHIIRGQPTSEVLFSLQSHEIQRLADLEDCIFVGRCADYVLKGKEVSMLRVFVRAPFEYRVRRKMELEGLSLGKAIRKVKRMDSRRRKYYEHYTGQEWGEDWDLDLDMGKRSMEEAVGEITRRYQTL